MAKSRRSTEVVYPEIKISLHQGKTSLTAEEAKQLLGWQEETDKIKFGTNYTFKDKNDNKVRCLNNAHNRRFSMGLALLWMKEILKGHWKLNGETLIIGRNGETISAQHRLVALVLAAQEWLDDKKRYPSWKSEPTMDCIIVYGIDESDEVVNTIDTGKGRNLTDVIYRSTLFASMNSQERSVCARILALATKLVQFRTAGIKGKQTHSDAMDFIAAHPKLLECVKHIYEEDSSDEKGLGKIARYLSPGYAAGLLYLMGSSSSDPDKYHELENPNEDSLDWKRWATACDFWVELAGGVAKLSAIKTLFDKSLEQGLSSEERWGVIVNAWNRYVDNKDITEAAIKLNYVTDEETGVRSIEEVPLTGGIDLGDPDVVDEELINAEDPTPDEIERRASKIRDRKSGKAKQSLTPKKAGELWDKGDVAWVRDSDGDHYLGVVQGPGYATDQGRMIEVQQGKDTWEVRVRDLSLEQPTGTRKIRMPKAAPPAKHKTLTPKQIIQGQIRWVDDGKREPFSVKILDVQAKLNVAKCLIQSGHRGAGNQEVIPLHHLRESQPQVA